MKRTIAFLLLLGVSYLPGCSKCSLIGCGPAATIYLDLPEVDWSTLRSWSVRACRNAVCGEGSLSSLPSVGEPDVGYGIPLAGLPEAEHVDYFVKTSHTSYTEWWNENVKNGDRYTVTVLDDADAPVASFEGTAKYTHSEPNGEACGPSCPHATFE